jgi:sulfoxide reductase heme-binding subunit YedZ
MAAAATVGVNLLAAAGPSPLWYLTRGTGLVALILLTLTVVLGVVITAGWTPSGWPQFATAGLHRNVSLLVVVVLGIHIVTAELDTFAPVGWLAVLLPFASAYRPVWLGLGTVAWDLLLALVITSLARRHIGQRAWRTIHSAAYLSWPVALVHGLGTGTDPRTPVMQAITVVCVLSVIIAAGWRLGWGWRVTPQRRFLVAAAAVAACVAVAGWAAGGPLRTGWSRRAGTPAALVASSRSATAVPAGVPANRSDPSWAAALSGSLRQRGPDPSGNVTITISGSLSGARQGTLTVALVGLAADGGVALKQSAVTVALSDGSRWTGQIVVLDGDQMAATITDGHGHSSTLDINLQINPASDAVTGAITATPITSGGRR